MECPRPSLNDGTPQPKTVVNRDIFFAMIIFVVYLGPPWDFSAGIVAVSFFFFSRQFLGRGLKLPN